MQIGEHQLLAVENLKTGSILVGGVGTGKSRASLLYFYTKELDGKINPLKPPTKFKDLYIITTAKKRDTKEWDMECCFFLLPNDDISVVVDSWNNIEKYKDVKNAFFIFDEQRVVGSGTWAKTFVHIAKKNNWILLSATPGDTWLDYVPVFLANGYFKSRSEFLKKHVIFKPFMKYPVIDRYIRIGYLEEIRNDILVYMKRAVDIRKHYNDVYVDYDKKLYFDILKNRWNPWKDEPISEASGLSQALRRVVNSDESRIKKVMEIAQERIKSIIFYNFDYELDILKKACNDIRMPYAECNGHSHKAIPDTDRWVYLVQYMAGAEGWNCISTDTIIFYSQNHSYKLMTQSAGRIERMNTPFEDLYYFYLKSNAYIDKAIEKCLEAKEDFNEHKFEEVYDDFEDLY